MNDSRSWHRSSFSDMAGNQCVEVAQTALGVLVRDSKTITTGRLAFGADAWGHFVASTGITAISPAGG
ncbi:DUF397 domain-containing protein [Streptomyces sp. NPDC001536]|uniref:DUF397 domain-containing protein n=1 Tax=Streptomyces sp. NPDC001536 TaxID=3364583 RepID=UPI0036B8AC9E